MGFLSFSLWFIFPFATFPLLLHDKIMAAAAVAAAMALCAAALSLLNILASSHPLFRVDNSGGGGSAGMRGGGSIPYQ